MWQGGIEALYSRHECTLSQIDTHPDMALYVASMQKPQQTNNHNLNMNLKIRKDYTHSVMTEEVYLRIYRKSALL